MKTLSMLWLDFRRHDPGLSSGEEALASEQEIFLAGVLAGRDVLLDLIGGQVREAGLVDRFRNEVMKFENEVRLAHAKTRTPA